MIITDAIMREAIKEIYKFREKEKLEELKKHKNRYIKYLEAKIQELEARE